MLNEMFELNTPDAIRNLTQPRLREILKNDGGEVEAEIYGTTVFANSLRHAKDYLQLVDFEQMALWATDYKRKGLAKALRDGDNLAAEEIERAAEKMIAPLLLTSAAVTKDGVEGMVPNVPAFIQGNPFSMRSRYRDMTGRGPLSLFIELTGSVVFNVGQNIMRSAATVALARALSIVRPITLWVTVTYGGESRLTQCAIRVETTPLDISRIAIIGPHIGNLVITASQASWATSKKRGSWAYGIPSLERTFAGEILGRVVSPGSEICYIGAGSAYDLQIMEDEGPEGWMRMMLRRFSPHLIEGTERSDEAADFGHI